LATVFEREFLNFAECDDDAGSQNDPHGIQVVPLEVLFDGCAEQFLVDSFLLLFSDARAGIAVRDAQEGRAGEELGHAPDALQVKDI
jgi:hypothetical protein